MLTKKNITNTFYLFLVLHLTLWTLIPSISNQNLPLDTIEALAWGSNLDWGYIKHPPFSAYVANFFYLIFKSNDWAYYFLSQICVIISFYFVWELSKTFFTDKKLALFSILILETIVFFNYTTPEFNVYVCQLPLKAGTVFFFWKAISNSKIYNWILTGLFCAFGILTHYSFLFLIVSLFLFFYLFLKKSKKIMKGFLISFLIFLIVIFPHVTWVFENNYETINYALKRTGVENKDLINHILNPITFLFKQFFMMLIFILLLSYISPIKKLKKLLLKKKDKKKIFLFSISLLPFLLVFFVSLITGAKIRTMWMSTFYLFFGVFFIYYLKDIIHLQKLNKSIYIIIFLFVLSPLIYLYVSLANDFKRTDYPGEEIARLVQNKWDDNFVNEIEIVVGDEWFAGNLSYHLENRPTWFNELKNEGKEIKRDHGVIYTGNPKILKKICPGVFGTIKPVGYCMIGKR